ncbi:YeiH family protein [Blastococcus saxobsidens]|nr:putative sulfate exporter family transporter [Blastococcus saxobsidens]
MAPGLVATAAAVGLSMAVTSVLPTVSPLVVAVALGGLLANVGGLRPAFGTGLAFAGRPVLRFGIVLLGLQLAVGEVIGLGAAGMAVVVITVVATFAATVLLGRALGVSRDLTILVASGFSICGAAAVAAAHGVTKSDEDDVALAVALVTIYGTVAMIALPLLGVPLTLRADQHGAWVGAGVHEVAQVVVAGSAVGGVALAVAVVVKLSRVVLLAPLVVGLGLVERRRTKHDEMTARPPLVPLFVLGFLAAVALRSTGIVSEGVLDVAGFLQKLALTAAMFALGTGVRLAAMWGTGQRALLLGAASTLVAAGVALVAVLALF